MKKQLLSILSGLALVIGTLVFGTNGTVGAAPADCSPRELNQGMAGYGGSDITSGDIVFGATSPYTVRLDIALAAPSCTGIVYTANLFDSDGALIETRSMPGDGINDVLSLAFEATVASCVSVSGTTSNGDRTLDSAPNSGTVPFCPGIGGGVQFK